MVMWAHPSRMPNSILIGSAAWQGIQSDTHRHTHTQTTPQRVAIGRVYAMHTMRSNNTNTEKDGQMQKLVGLYKYLPNKNKSKS